MMREGDPSMDFSEFKFEKHDETGAMQPRGRDATAPAPAATPRSAETVPPPAWPPGPDYVPYMPEQPAAPVRDMPADFGPASAARVETVDPAPPVPTDAELSATETSERDTSEVTLDSEARRRAELDGAMRRLTESLRIPESDQPEVQLTRRALEQFLEASPDIPGRAREIERIVSGGVRFEKEDQELPLEYQSIAYQLWKQDPENHPNPAEEPEKYVAGANSRTASIHIYPAFSQLSLEEAAFYIGHELGEILQRVDTTGAPGQVNREGKPEAREGKELLLDVIEYERRFGPATRDPSWNTTYVRGQFDNRNALAINEQLADDIGDYFLAHDWQSFAVNRLRRIENAEMLLEQFEQHDVALAPFMQHFQETYQWLHSQYQGKKDGLKERPKTTNVSLVDWPPAEYGMPKGGAGDVHGSVQEFRKQIDLWIDKIWGL